MIVKTRLTVYNEAMFSKPFAYLLWLFSGFGWLGLHRFYLRKPFTGILWALTGGLGGLGSIYDLLTLGLQVNRANLELALFNQMWQHGGYGGTRYAEDASSRVIRDNASIERTALRVAKANRGAVSAAELALEAGIEIDAAKKVLEELARKGHAEMRIRRNGTLVFIIHEFSEDEDGYADIYSACSTEYSQQLNKSVGGMPPSLQPAKEGGVDKALAVVFAVGKNDKHKNWHGGQFLCRCPPSGGNAARRPTGG
jgi:hypothetical protein